MNDNKILEFKQDLKNIEAKVIEDNTLSKVEIELIGIRKFLMELQIKQLALRKSAHFLATIEAYQAELNYPDPKLLKCPKCHYFKFQGSEATDEHDTYLILKCGECGYQYSPSHD